MLFKPWLFYVAVVWSPGPLLPDSQKTVMLQFDSPKECRSIAAQVREQIEATGGALRIARIGCYPCAEVMEKSRCPATKSAAPKNVAPKSAAPKKKK
jgi:hypothetical protein